MSMTLQQVERKLRCTPGGTLVELITPILTPRLPLTDGTPVLSSSEGITTQEKRAAYFYQIESHESEEGQGRENHGRFFGVQSIGPSRWDTKDHFVVPTRYIQQVRWEGEQLEP